MNEKKKFLIPEIDIVVFDTKDVIATSGEQQEGDMGEVSLEDLYF